MQHAGKKTTSFNSVPGLLFKIVVENGLLVRLLHVHVAGQVEGQAAHPVIQLAHPVKRGLTDGVGHVGIQLVSDGQDQGVLHKKYPFVHRMSLTLKNQPPLPQMRVNEGKYIELH